MYFRNLLIWRAQFPYPQLLSPVNYLFWRLCGKWERRNVFVSIQWYADKDIQDASQSGLNFFEFCKLPRCGVLGQNTLSGLVGWSQSSIKRSQFSFPSCLETTSLVSRIYGARTRSPDDVIYCSVRQIAQHRCQNGVKSLPTLPIGAFDENDSTLNFKKAMPFRIPPSPARKKLGREKFGPDSLAFICLWYFSLVVLILWCPSSWFPIEYC